MNLKQLGILLTLVVLIGGAGLLLHNRQQSSWTGGGPDAGKKLLGEFSVNDVAHISIVQGTNELNLVKKDDFWRVRERANYPANFPQISEFLLKARDLKVVQTEEIGPSQLARMELATGTVSNAAVVVVFADSADKPMRTLLLGKMHLGKSPSPAPAEGDGGMPDGRYVAVGTNAQQVALIADPLNTVVAAPDQWIDKTFIQVEKPKMISIQFPVATNSWVLTRETESGDWKLSNTNFGEVLDAAKLSGVTSAFSSPTISSVMAGAKLGASETNPPTIVRMDTFDGFHYTINVGAKTNEDYPVTVSVTAALADKRDPGKDEKPEDKTRLDQAFQDAQRKLADKLKVEQGFQQWTYLLPSWTVDPVLKERVLLLADKKPAAENATDKPDATGQMPPLVPMGGL